MLVELDQNSITLLTICVFPLFIGTYVIMNRIREWIMINRMGYTKSMFLSENRAVTSTLVKPQNKTVKNKNKIYNWKDEPNYIIRLGNTIGNMFFENNANPIKVDEMSVTSTIDPQILSDLEKKSFNFGMAMGIRQQKIKDMSMTVIIIVLVGIAALVWMTRGDILTAISSIQMPTIPTLQ